MTESRPRVAVVGIPGGWSSEALADALGARTGFRRVIDLRDVVLDVTSGRVHWHDLELTGLDGLVVKKVGDVYSPAMLDRLEILRSVEAAGVRVFSRPAGMLRLIDRLSCTVTLASAGIPMPETVVTECMDRAVEAVRRFGSAVLKPMYSTKARGMVPVDADAERLESELLAFRAAGNTMLYVQRRVPVLERDLGVCFLGGRHVGTYARVRAEGAWNTTIHAGGSYESFDAAAEIVELAGRAQALFDLDFTSVDVALTADGPLVFEVSAFGGFRGMRDGLGVDAASLYADYVIEELGRG